MAEVILVNPKIFVALPLLALPVVAFAWRRRFRPLGAFFLRLAMVILAIGALSRPLWLPAPMAASADAEDQSRRVILVDQSASLGATRAALRLEAERLATAADDSVVILFSDRAIVAPTLQTDRRDSAPPSVDLNEEITNFENAIALGTEMLKGHVGRLLLISDGVATAGDTGAVTAQVARLDLPVDVVIVRNVVDQGEVRMVGLDLPQQQRQGEAAAIGITVHSTQFANITMTLRQDGAVLNQEMVAVEPGMNQFAFESNAEEVGLHTFEASVTPPRGRDAQIANNTVSAFTQVYSPPRILVVGDEASDKVRAVEGQVSRFTGLLRGTGFDPRVISASELSDRLSELEPYAGMVLVDVPATAFELEQMIAVQEYVRTLGRGLLVVGGRNSLSLGQYEATPLEELLPISLEPPPREERPPVALLLIIDHSGSMVARGGLSKLAMAKEAAIRATDVLRPEDLIGVLVFDNDYEWIVPFQRVPDGAAFLELQGKIATISGGGGTEILKALEEGLPALAAQVDATGARHAVLLTDGKSTDALRLPERYADAVDVAIKNEITLSTIAIGSDADQDLLADLAERGLGRYHFAAAAEDIPELTIAESAILSSDALQEGVFSPVAFMPHPLLRGLSLDGGGGENVLPLLRGYVGVTPRPPAEMVLQVGPGDPLLSVWGYGLGRVAAWTSDTGEEWAPRWLVGPAAVRFWGQLVSYVLPTPDLGLLQVGVDVEPDGVVTVTADGVTATGDSVDLARTWASLTQPSGRTTQMNLVQTAPGRYQQRVLIRDPGAYELTVKQIRHDRTESDAEESTTIGFVIPYRAEFALPAPETGEELLRQIADSTGGRVLTLGAFAGQNRPPQDSSEAQNEPVELWPGLLLAALVLWPIEIAWRRWGRLRIQ